jgi:hypothetical protein
MEPVNKKPNNTDGPLYVIGALCIRNHRYKNTNFSLRYKKGDHQCVDCSRERGKSQREGLSYLRRKVQMLRYRAARKAIDFDLDEEWLLSNRPSKCSVLGIDLIYSSSDKHEPRLASVDRIDSNKGYTKDNCRVISYRANVLKNNASLDEIRKVYEDLIKCNLNNKDASN